MIRPHFQILPDYIASRSLLRCVMLPITHAFAPYYALFAYGLGFGDAVHGVTKQNNFEKQDITN